MHLATGLSLGPVRPRDKEQAVVTEEIPAHG